jgi:uncharacterized protein (DUF58 family)
MRLTARGKACALFVAVLWSGALVLRSQIAALAACVLSCYLFLYLATLNPPSLTVTRRFERVQILEGEVVRETLAVEYVGRRRHITIRETPPEGVEPVGSPQVVVALQHHHASRHEIAWQGRTWGVKRFHALEIVATDPLQLLEAAEHAEGESPIRVLPRADPLDKYSPRASNPEPSLGAHNVSKPGDGAEFFTLREYQSGDSIRRINWKASARSTATMVNQVTRDTYARAVIFLDLREKEEVGAHESSPHVRNVRATAQILGTHDRVKDHVVIVRVDEGVSRLSSRANPKLLEQVEALAECRTKGAYSMKEAVRGSLSTLHPRSPVYFITSAALDEDLEDAVRLVSAARGIPIVVSPALPPLDAPGAAFVASRRVALDRARAAGARVHDWPEGRPLAVMLRAA